ncbi:hypothetical protein [uncultured Salipiger sp.]|uniref:hypothetical protein n=1 Tax=uncultured Salipiger sp. TaxID=499810 RepID=UPI0025913B60|nr:hypothetical protein [uncultured Salipiger sp.]
MRPENRAEESEPEGVFAMLLQGAIRDTPGLWLAVLIGTVSGAILCVCCGLPLILSRLGGGILVLAVFLAWELLWLAQRRDSRHPCPCPQARRAHGVFAR